MKKINNRPLQLFFSLSCLFVLFFLIPPFVFADAPNDVFLFKKLALLNTDDRTGKDYGEKIEKIVRDELEQMLRFDIIPQDKVRVQHPLSQQSLGTINKILQADGFIVGRVDLSNEMINISLEILDKRGEMFALELLAVNELASLADLEENVRELVVKLIRRIPYKAVITQVKNGVVTFDAGLKHGVETGSKVSLFEIIGVKRHPYTDEIISFKRKDLGVIQVTQVEDLSATGKIISSKKGAKIKAGSKADFIPSEKFILESHIEKNELLAEKKLSPELLNTGEQRLTKEPPGRPRGSLAVSAGLLLNDYKISSNQFNFRRDTSPVTSVTMAGEYWVLAPLGADVSYSASWIYFKQTGSVPKTDASLSWLTAHLKYRHFFSSDRLSPEIVGSVGYHIYDFEVDKSDSKYFNNIKYSGIDIALTASYPMTSKMKGVVNVGYLPSLDIEEDPVTSGTNPHAYGYYFGLAEHFNVSDKTALALRYYYLAYHAKFSGDGTRGAGTTDTEIRDLCQGINLSLIYEW
ncbi:MAG: hypothetical protein IT392_11005 [Nitrospirae bacterium]|nr:hypothetical protein [Nitrospirota bacterium]